VVAVLNEALATELVCVLRYKRHYFMAQGINAATEFLQHATDEQGHADRIATRIVQLQGAPNFDPEGLATRSHAEYVEGEDLVDMIKEELVAERVAIDSHNEIIRWLGDKDVTTRRLMEDILRRRRRARRRPAHPPAVPVTGQSAASPRTTTTVHGAWCTT